MPTDFAGKRVVVMGLGRFGGGIGVTKWLVEQGARVHVTDLSPEEKLSDSLRALKGLALTFRLGSHDECDLDGCDLLVVNPAVDKRKASFFHAAVRRGIPWSSEMNLFLERCPGRIVGITGTVGKSTTTAMVGAILDEAKTAEGWQHGQVWLGGNIGKSLLGGMAGMKPDDIVVLELSSFQLEDAAECRRSPHIALVTNLRDNHLDRHGTLEAYAAAKANIAKFQKQEDWLILPFEDVGLFPAEWLARPHLYRFGVVSETRQVRLVYPKNGQQTLEELFVTLSVPGLHNVENAAAALAIARILGARDTVSLAALQQFSGLAHRLEFVREFGGVRYYNDSKATSPEAAVTSMRAFDGGLIVLVGGSDKGSSFVEMGRTLATRAKAVICMGETGDKIRGEVVPTDPEGRRPIIRTAGNSQEAVELARALATAGDVVLLSPGCASFDWYRNYEERGDTFKLLVKALT